jgi:tetratricopeptide (TPR) repeat protein
MAYSDWISRSAGASTLADAQAEAHNNLGIAFYKKSQLVEAIHQFQEALRLEPDYAEAHNNLGTVLGRRGQTDEAIRQFQEALRLKPGFVDAQGLIAGYANTRNTFGSSLKKEVGARRFTAAEAGALAEQLANEKAWVLHKCQPFHDGPPAEFAQGHWVWDELRGYRVFHVEAKVKFAADGTNPDVDVMLLDSRLNNQLRR